MIMKLPNLFVGKMDSWEKLQQAYMEMLQHVASQDLSRRTIPEDLERLAVIKAHED